MSALRTPRSACVGCALALALALCGCSPATVVGRHRTLHLALSEYRVDPQSVRARPGRLTIVVRNYGHRTHNLVLSRNGQVLGSTKPLWPGMSARIRLKLPAGSYLMASTILGDQAFGEYGTLVVGQDPTP